MFSFLPFLVNRIVKSLANPSLRLSLSEPCSPGPLLLSQFFFFHHFHAKREGKKECEGPSYNSGSKSAGAAKAARSAHRLLQLLHLDHFRRVDALNDELCHPIALLDIKVRLCVVEEQNLDRTTVVRVNDTRARIDEVF